MTEEENVAVSREVIIKRLKRVEGQVRGLQKMVAERDPDKKFRLYAGYAGWAPGQLDRELARGGWHVLQADVATVFEKVPSEIWPELINRSSGLWVRALPYTS